MSIEEALSLLRSLPFEDKGFAKVDLHRTLRKGFPEVVLGEGKSPEQTVVIAEEIYKQGGILLITRVGQEVFDIVHQRIPEATYHPLARAITANKNRDVTLRPGISVVTAGTADIPVAEEATVTAELMGNEVEQIYDVGIAGIHRLLEYLPTLQRAKVVIAVAGMEGALPSVIGGLISAPVIGVPTSTGYGASFQGITALLAMLNSCAPGVSVVNIDNGFGAGYLASLINQGPSEKL